DAGGIIDATAATLSGNRHLKIKSVSIDTRTIRPGDLFVALRGVRDGHEFVETSAQLGAAAAIVERGRCNPNLPCFEVDDTLRALGALARYHLERLRARSSLPVIAIGGAAGKTTTKQITAALMSTLFGEILATPGNLNNLIGVPMTLLTLTPGHHAAVLECGTNQRGEIAQLSDIVRPDIAMVLNVDIEHTEGLGSLEGVADEESALFAQARCAIVSCSEELLIARIPAGIRTVTFGRDIAADVRLVSRNVISPGRQAIKFELARWLVDSGTSVEIEATLNLLGAPIAENAAAAVAATATAWGRPLRHDQLAAMCRALSSVHGEPGRLSTRELNGIVVIDDTYNANPRSVRAALSVARETADLLKSRLIVALGDMLELGKLSQMMHEAAMRDVITVHPDYFIAVGSEFIGATNHMPQEVGAPRIKVVRNSAEGGDFVRTIVRRGDVLLLKGSRATRMEHIIDCLSAAS
ncbi:MAG TPA: UDP-N-acetylmuramoyl-tripeptide--D-alanyl-D-alanine ligase, partial [Candidatus Binataceae bacterium]|nr:UDP-N-acetylmuramoyl-tripeptide--D-alanyl-D-alanine ligase [Candidatus Binataceae bacterium]